MDPVTLHPRRLWSVRRPIAAGLALLALVSLVGCNFFRPSSPEIPTRNQVVARYTAAETTLVTLGLAIQDKSATNGQSAYVGCFADTNTDGVDFHAFFDPITLTRFPNLPGGQVEWTVRQEEIFYAKLSRLLPGATFEFAWGAFPEAGDDDHQPTTAILYRSYEIVARPPDVDTFVSVAKGNVDLHLAQLRGSWRIVRWQDHEDTTARFNDGQLSFGQLRLTGP